MPEEKTIELQIKELMVERLFMEIDPAEIEDEDPLGDKWDVDSVQLFEVVVGLEEVFDISFEDEDFTVENFATVRAISNCVRRKLMPEGASAEADESEVSGEAE